MIRTLTRWLQLNGIRTVRRAWERYRFQDQRIDYYDYLAALLSGADGLRTLKDVFFQDAQRYGEATLRGRLSQFWLLTYQRAGGDLYATWEHHMPRAELALIRASQSLGNSALLRTLTELASVLRLLQDAARLLSATLWPAALAMLVATLMSLAVPWFTLPRLMDTFATVPTHYYGRLTSSLVTFASIVDGYYLFFLVLIPGSTALLIWSLPNTAGLVRRHLDRVLWWRVYRDVSALRFLSFLLISLGDAAHGPVQLRSALLRQRMGASLWLSSHIDVMLAHIDHGKADPEIFNTGLFTQELFWFLNDMVLARGLVMGLSLARHRIQSRILGVVARQAAVMRWVILLACVAYVLGLTLWHYAVIDELRRALTFYFTS